MQGSYIFPGISATRTKQRARVRDVCGQKNGAEHKSLGPFVRGASHFPEGSRRETSRRPSHDDVRHRYRGACRSSTWKHISRHILSGDVKLKINALRFNLDPRLNYDRCKKNNKHSRKSNPVVSLSPFFDNNLLKLSKEVY